MEATMIRNDWESQQERARLNRMDIIDAKLSRREMFKYGLLTAGGMLVAKSGLSIRAAGAGTLVSPPTKAWSVPLPIPKPLEPASNFKVSDLTAGCGTDAKEVQSTSLLTQSIGEGCDKPLCAEEG
jgi:hypothetical protein